jgi:hypothetical protein
LYFVAAAAYEGLRSAFAPILHATLPAAGDGESESGASSKPITGGDATIGHDNHERQAHTVSALVAIAQVGSDFRPLFTYYFFQTLWGFFFWFFTVVSVFPRQRSVFDLRDYVRGRSGSSKSRLGSSASYECGRTVALQVCVFLDLPKFSVSS